jgi:hypothetical protein
LAPSATTLWSTLYKQYNLIISEDIFPIARRLIHVTCVIFPFLFSETRETRETRKTRETRETRETCETRVNRVISKEPAWV